MGSLMPGEPMQNEELVATRFRLAPRSPRRVEVVAAPRSFDLAGFDVKIEGDLLTARPPTPSVSQWAARDTLEPLLRAWVTRIAITEGVELDLEDAGGILVTSSGRRLQFGPVTTVTVETLSGEEPPPRRLSELPTPTSSYKETPLVADLQRRLAEVREGRAPLLYLAEYTYTTFTTHFGGWEQASFKLRVEPKVLATLHGLAGYYHETHQRKNLDPNRNSYVSPLGIEWVWEAVRTLVLRIGEYEGNGEALPMISMEDLVRRSAQRLEARRFGGVPEPF